MNSTSVSEVLFLFKTRMVNLALLWDVPIIQSVNILEKSVEKVLRHGTLRTC